MKRIQRMLSVFTLAALAIATAVLLAVSASGASALHRRRRQALF